MAGASPQQGRSRATGQAGLPTPNSSHSYWHRDPSKRLLGHRTTSELPLSAELIVVGSGITGTFSAQELVRGGRGVVLLEAREACWGATGRNGGHCQPGVWDSPPDIARFELATYNLIKELVAKHNIPCDWQVVGGVHPIFSPKVLAAAKKQIQRLQQYPDLQHKAVLIQDRAELVSKHVPNAIAAIYQPDAAKCWPYKLVTWLLERLLDDHDATAFNLQTNTPVQRLERSGASWIVHTERGQIQAQDVLLACNAYTSYLLPEMTGLITPVRGQVCALEPPAGSVQLPHSYVWMKSADHQYLIHRGPEDASGDRSIIFGGERLSVQDGEEGLSCDSEVNPIISEALHRCINDALLLVPNGENGVENKAETEPAALHATYDWTGIMGYTSDGGAWVGRVPDLLLGDLSPDAASSEAGAGTLWISGGYTGHGMPVAARCGIAVAEMILGKEGGVQLPTAWMASDERVRTARQMSLPQTLDEILKDLPEC